MSIEILNVMQMFALHYPFSNHDIMDEIRKEEAIENAKRRKARKERARELTRLRELEIKKSEVK